MNCLPLKQTEWADYASKLESENSSSPCIANPKLRSRETVPCFCNHCRCDVDADSGKSECCCLARAITRTATHIEEAHLWDCSDGVEQSSGSLPNQTRRIVVVEAGSLMPAT